MGILARAAPADPPVLGGERPTEAVKRREKVLALPYPTRAETSATFEELCTRRDLASCRRTALRKRPGVTPVVRWNTLMK